MQPHPGIICERLIGLPQRSVVRARDDGCTDRPRVGHDERRTHPGVNTDRKPPVNLATIPD
ncbi:MAG: hypothetical protein ACK55I_23440, partial [bacterium]